jgi:hypothetical protein
MVPFRRPSRIVENPEGEEENNPQMTQRNTDKNTIEGVGSRRPPALLSFICVHLCHLWIAFFSRPSDGSWATRQ